MTEYGTFEDLDKEEKKKEMYDPYFQEELDNHSHPSQSRSPEKEKDDEFIPTEKSPSSSSDNNPPVKKLPKAPEGFYPNGNGNYRMSLFSKSMFIILTFVFLFLGIYAVHTFATKNFSPQVNNNVKAPNVTVPINNNITIPQTPVNINLSLGDAFINDIANKVAEKLNITNLST